MLAFSENAPFKAHRWEDCKAILKAFLSVEIKAFKAHFIEMFNIWRFVLMRGDAQGIFG